MSAGSVDVSDEDKRRHREVEKSLKEVRIEFHSFSCIYANILSQYCVLTTLCIVRRSRSWPHRLRYVEMIPKFNILAKTAPQGTAVGIWRFRKVYDSEGESLCLDIINCCRTDILSANASHPSCAILITRSRVLQTAHFQQPYARAQIRSGFDGRYGITGFS